MSDLEKLLRFGKIAERMWHAIHLIEDAPAGVVTPLPDILQAIDGRHGRLKATWEWLDAPKGNEHGA